MKKNNNKKSIVRLSESKLQRIVAESIKKALNEDMSGDHNPYKVYVCEWNGSVTPKVYCDNDTMAETLEEFKSDAWSYCEFADNPTIAILYDETSGEAVEYYCSPHFTMAKYGK